EERFTSSAPGSLEGNAHADERMERGDLAREREVLRGFPTLDAASARWERCSSTRDGARRIERIGEMLLRAGARSPRNRVRILDAIPGGAERSAPLAGAVLRAPLALQYSGFRLLCPLGPPQVQAP